MADRFIVEHSFDGQVGWHSMIIDTQSHRRIFVSGVGHQIRAQKRADQENEAWRRGSTIRQPSNSS